MMEFTDHREIAYKLWVESGRDVKKVVEQLRAGDPDEEWDAFPAAKPALIRQWAYDHGWAIRQFDDAQEMAPDLFAQTRAAYHRLGPVAVNFLGDVLNGEMDKVDPRVVRNKIDVAKHITAVDGHLPLHVMDMTKQNRGPQKDYTRSIADMSIEELRTHALRGISSVNATDSVTNTSTILNMTTDPDQSIIEADFDYNSEPSEPPDGGSKRTQGMAPLEN